MSADEWNKRAPGSSARTSDNEHVKKKNLNAYSDPCRALIAHGHVDALYFSGYFVARCRSSSSPPMPIPFRRQLRTPRSPSLALPSIPRVAGRRWQASESATAAENPPAAGGQNAKIGESKLFRGTRDLALRTPGIMWTDENAGSTSLVMGKETQKMNMYHAIRDALQLVSSLWCGTIVQGLYDWFMQHRAE